VQGAAGARQQLGATCEIKDVVAVATVRGTSAGRHETTVTQLAQVVRDEALAPVCQLAQLAHAAIAARELLQ
jgi:hypothetical protein